MIIVVGNEKGGVGKSTLSFSLAAYLAKQGESVALVDTDTQRTSSHWAASGNAKGHAPEFLIVEQTTNPAPSVLKLDQNYGVVVVDMGARDYAKFRELAQIADLFIAPTRAGQGDLESLVNLAGAMAEFNTMRSQGSLPFVAVLNCVSSARETEDAIAALNTVMPFGHVLPCSIKERIVWRDAHRDGVSIFDIRPKSRSEAAVAEFEAFVAGALEIFKQSQVEKEASHGN